MKTIAKLDSFQIDDLGVDVVPGSCAAAVTGPPCVVAVIVIIALIANPPEIGG